MTTVIWVDYPAAGKGITRGYWDQGMLEEYFAGDLWRTPHTFEHHTFDSAPDGGAVVVVPARYHVDHVDRLNTDLARLPWALVLLTSDEESLFPPDAIRHPNCRVWTMTPRPGVHSGDRFLGEYYPPHARQHIAGCEHLDRPLDWFWSGQVNHPRRRDLERVLRRIPGGRQHRTPGFTRGLPPAEYYQQLCSAKIAPCPSGPGTPDSFRLYEALEAGCVPVADGHAPQVPQPGYWKQLFRDPPFPVVDDWSQLPGIVDRLRRTWREDSVRCSAWWQQQKRRLANRLDDDIAALSTRPQPSGPGDLITVLVTTSPIPSHPDTSIIEHTVASVRAQLPDAEIIVACDGVRPEQADRGPSYTEYLRRLCWLTNHEWRNTVPLVVGEHLHQANLARAALGLVRTPLVVFVEHDTPLCETIPWPELCAAVTGDTVDLIRFHHEAHILDVHQPMMIDRDPIKVHGAPLLRTFQWSQRPHLASTDYYRRVLGRYFGRDSRTMIEDAMHGVVAEAWAHHGMGGWEQHRIAIYAPPGDMKRSLHLDGRAGDPKFDMVYAYDGDTPPGAPAPTAGRT